jgi:energy-converting hydrogenase Eha subunit E
MGLPLKGARLFDLVAAPATSAPRSVVVRSEQLVALALVVAVSLVFLCVQQRRFVLVTFIAWAVFAHAGPFIVAWPLLRHG